MKPLFVAFMLLPLSAHAQGPDNISSMELRGFCYPLASDPQTNTRDGIYDECGSELWVHWYEDEPEIGWSIEGKLSHPIHGRIEFVIAGMQSDRRPRGFDLIAKKVAFVPNDDLREEFDVGRYHGCWANEQPPLLVNDVSIWQIHCELTLADHDGRSQLFRMHYIGTEMPLEETCAPGSESGYD
jgi:hypothetical protein